MLLFEKEDGECFMMVIHSTGTFLDIKLHLGGISHDR